MTESTTAWKSQPSWLRLPRLLFEIAGAVMISGMALLTISDVFMRNVLNSPIAGAYDVNVYWFMVSTSALGLWYAEYRREHIRVSLIGALIRGKAALILDAIVLMICIAFVLSMGWYALDYALQMTQVQEYVGVDRVPVWPVRHLVVIGLFAYAVVLVFHLGKRLRTRKEVEHESRAEGV